MLLDRDRDAVLTTLAILFVVDPFEWGKKNIQNIENMLKTKRTFAKIPNCKKKKIKAKKKKKKKKHDERREESDEKK